MVRGDLFSQPQNPNNKILPTDIIPNNDIVINYERYNVIKCDEHTQNILSQL